jgi:hypothetical protein
LAFLTLEGDDVDDEMRSLQAELRTHKEEHDKARVLLCFNEIMLVMIVF